MSACLIDVRLTRTPCSKIPVAQAPSPIRCYRAIASTWRSFPPPTHVLRRCGARRSLAPRGSYSFASRQRRQAMQFQKGESGNPAGRPRGARNRTTILLQQLLEDDGEALARKAIDLAKGGDLAALRMCMDRLMPARKHEPVAFELPRLNTAADTVTAAATIVAAVAAGELAPSEAADIAKVVDIYVRALATQEFEERLAKLERSPAPASVPANADA